MTTQLCFDPKAIATWVEGRRAAGITLPGQARDPGVAEIPKLIEISARIGVRDACKFILKNTAFVGQLLASGGIYRPTGSSSLSPRSSPTRRPASSASTCTRSTRCASTESWRRDYLAALRKSAGVATPA